MALELREFAEQVLFATRLEDKLACPDVINDEHPGPARPAPEAPGRPAGLAFRRADTERPRFPGPGQLEHETERGRLLHFFANHELLAVELMALVLLRFPDAPPAFRRGVLQTLKDEQEHVRWYCDRMRACGVGFGDLPVSGFFWRAVSSMESPIDYVAGLSLTFEQANLDFARHYATQFRAVGDADTSALLERIYRDEIGHVAYGLKWFRRWKDPRHSDWDAFCRHLRFPLSPQRAKGFSLNVEGRRAAGLDPDFIARLAVFAQSKGRTPTVWLFNPFAEAHLAGGAAFTPRKHQRALARDLAHLPLFLARQDDVVLVPRVPEVQFLAGLQQAGIALPEWALLDSDGRAAPFPDRKIGQLRPWAWSPDSVRALAPLEGSLGAGARPVAERFHPGLAELYSKAWSAGFLRRWLARHPDELWLCPAECCGVEARTEEEVRQQIHRIRESGHHRVVVKEALGQAGSQAIRLWEPEVLETQWRWMRGRLAAGQALVIEPWLERAFDFSIQFERRGERLERVGFTTLLNDLRGQFIANRAAPDAAIRPPARVVELLRSGGAPADLGRRLTLLFDDLAAALNEELAARGFEGALGIDALVERTREGGCRLKPVVEINPRHTMGRLTLELLRFTTAGSHLQFQLFNAASPGGGETGFPGIAARLAVERPLRLEGQPVPRLHQGALALADPQQVESCLPVLFVERTAGALPSPEIRSAEARR